MTFRFGQIAVILILCTGGCDASTPDNPSQGTDPYAQGAGFVSLSSREVAVDGFGLHAEGKTADAKIFYAFVPAKVSPEDAPVFLIFNGGPGAATSSALAAWGTGPFSITTDGRFQENPGDLSGIGNLVYIDTRQAGFSFDEIDAPASEAARRQTFSFLNFNLYTDVSDILLTFLRVLEDRPLLLDNPVITVAESFGGARSAVLLSLVRSAVSGGSLSPFYRDDSLKEALHDHFEKIDASDPVAAAASQFSHQILIQPGRVLPTRVEAAHTLYSLCEHISDDDPRIAYCDGRTFDYSDIREPEGFFEARNHLAQSLLVTDAGFERFFGISWKGIDGFSPLRRERAFRFASLDEKGLDAGFSTLQALAAWDAHHITMHLEPYFSWQEEDGPFESYDPGEWAASPFVESLRTVSTFITDAYFDFAVDSSEFPAALLEWNALEDAPVIVDAAHRTDEDPDAARPGWMAVTFATGESQRIRMPEYKSSGHMVPMYEPRAFFEDVRTFLVDTGL